jgi:molybdopterin converting factor subunit 1
MHQIRVDYFAVLREHVGLPSEQLSTHAGTVGELYDELHKRHVFPDIGPLKVAVNDEFGDWQTPLADGDAVVFIPPVAGG